ncbi:putative polysaccharide biosynthesis protein [Psychromonas sp. CNPT3]|uniref:AAA family ATPase n=1 Tax=Psychromonas sp. CNPT3 TaxID=314282 RepID=UPI00006E9CBC|nr:AAA family ATPase [Psychromonas sp. CNPT3]AGH80205.1 putative polysaccharide biosynthesis protein [Psychromonas sp. CNPT3]
MNIEKNSEDLLHAQHQAAENEKQSRQQISSMQEDQQLSNAELDDLKIIYAGTKDYQALNEYRELRTKLLNRCDHKNFVCMISSITPGAGSTHISINLAASIALDLSKTALIIDCNTHNKTSPNYFKIKSEFGLTNFLGQDTDDIEDIIYQSGIPRVRFIPIGIKKESAAEYFSSEKMELFIQRLKERYPDRFIILDTPPIERHAESQILVSLCDFTLLVTRYAKASKDQIQAAIDLVGEEKLAGIIFNN